MIGRIIKIIGVLSLAALALLVFLGRAYLAPAQLPPLVDEAGQPISGGIASLEPVTLNGTTQWIQIRGRDARAPLLLYLSGGPCGSEMPWLRHYQPGLERHFVVIHWDQRGAAKSYGAADWNRITPQQFEDDAGALIELLLQRFGQQRLLLVGNSWGSILGVRVAARWPERFFAYVGVTQQVNVAETDRLGWERTLDRARKAGDGDAVQTLEAIGPPPYKPEDFAGHYWKLIQLQGRLGGSPETRARVDGQLGIALAAREYSIVDRINFFRGLWYGWTRVYSQLGDLDYERSASRLRVPVELFLSHDDITVPAAPAERWLSNLEAPTKRVTWFDGFSHGLVYESGPAFVDAMVDVAKRHGALT